MQVTITTQGAKTLVVIEGRLDATTVNQFQQDIQPLMEGENPDIELDCASLEYISSQGLRMFLILQKSVNARGGHLVVTHMIAPVREVFDITGFSGIIHIQ